MKQNTFLESTLFTRQRECCGIVTMSFYFKVTWISIWRIQYALFFQWHFLIHILLLLDIIIIIRYFEIFSLQSFYQPTIVRLFMFVCTSQSLESKFRLLDELDLRNLLLSSVAVQSSNRIFNLEFRTIQLIINFSKKTIRKVCAAYIANPLSLVRSTFLYHPLKIYNRKYTLRFKGIRKRTACH